MTVTPGPVPGPQGGDALTGSGEGSDTRAASPQGGSRSGGERCDEDQRDRRDRTTVSAATTHPAGRDEAAGQTPETVNNTGVSGFDRSGDRDQPDPEGDVDAASS